MWNTWLEKGKELAASVDKKLNEAVGAGDLPTTATTTATTLSSSHASNNHLSNHHDHATTAISSSIANRHHPSTHHHHDDAWNDDFDDDDNNNGDHHQHFSNEQVTNKQEEQQQQQQQQEYQLESNFSMDSDVEHISLDANDHQPVVEVESSSYLQSAMDYHQQRQQERAPEATAEIVPEAEGDGWKDEHDGDDIGNVEELDLDVQQQHHQQQQPPHAPTHLSSVAATIPIPHLPNPIQAFTSILSSPLAKHDNHSDNNNIDELHSHEESELIPIVQVNDKSDEDENEPSGKTLLESTPADAAAGGAWENDLYDDTEEQQAKQQVVPPSTVEKEIQEAVITTSTTTTTSSSFSKDLPLSSSPFPLSSTNGDDNHTKTHPKEVIPNSDDSLNQPKDDLALQRLQEDHQFAMAILQSKLEEVQQQLELREQQLGQKAIQISELEAMHETEREELRKKIHETKEEAKKRIQKAKERVASMEERLNVGLKSANEDAGSQQELVAALRAEGESLARKQSEMEKAVRAAKAEARELRESLTAEIDAKERALEKIVHLEGELKNTKESLSAARKGESQAGKLESELSMAREDCNAKATTILSLEQQIKELKAETKELKTEVESSKRGATMETEREIAKLRKEHNEVIADLELKLRTSEREAGVREDALRHEVAELRKRWQDAVRRADALSMDVQSSTAPLLRQLESMERQNRARASAWADLETKLRAELEEHVIQNEQLSKERNELKTKHSRLERISKERDEELTNAKATIEELTIKTERLERKLATMEEEGVKLKEEWAEVERLANEGVARVRSEMTQTVVESETRYRSQIDSLEEELKMEKEKRRQLEHQVEELLANAGMIGSALSGSVSSQYLRKDNKPRKLRKAEGQADILAGALNGIDSGDDGEGTDPVNGDDDDDDDDDDEGREATGGGVGISNSFAAMEQLHQRLTGAKFELESLRRRLTESERTREALLEELGESRLAKEKLPLFETKIKELTEQNYEKELEIQGLREDIAEVRELYRTQLNMLLEEKAATVAAAEQGLNNNNNGGSTNETTFLPSSNEGQESADAAPQAAAPPAQDEEAVQS